MQSRTISKKKQCLMLQPFLVEKLGRTPSMFLQQVHYWITCNSPETGRVIDNRRWIYNSAKEWAAQLCLSERQVTRVVSALKNIGVLLVDRLSHIKSDRTNWYSIDYQKLEALLPGLELNIKPGVVPKKEILPTPTDKMSEPFGHNGGMYNKEAETTSEINLLSEEKPVVENTSLQQVHVVQEDILSISQNSNTNTPPEPSSASSPTTTPPSNTLASDLLEIWNQTVGQRQGEEGNLLQLTKKRAQYLVAAFKFRFESNLSKWKQFCQQVTSSAFLMGKAKSTFRASLDWVLKFDIIQRILEGDFGVNKTPCVDEEAVSLKTEAITQTIETSGEGEPIKRLRRSILQALGEQTYQSWFADMPMTPVPTTNGGMGGIQLHTKNQFACDYVQTNYLDKLTSLTDCELVVVVESSNSHHTGSGNELVLEQGLQ